MKTLLIAILPLAFLTACDTTAPVEPPQAPAAASAAQAAPAPPKPEGGPQAPGLSPEAVKHFKQSR